MAQTRNMFCVILKRMKSFPDLVLKFKETFQDTIGFHPNLEKSNHSMYSAISLVLIKVSEELLV